MGRYLCRSYYARMKFGQRGCNKAVCRFYHPNPITESDDKDFRREPGRCYCGASLRTMVNNKPYRDENDNGSTFYVLCSRTGKGIRRCKH